MSSRRVAAAVLAVVLTVLSAIAVAGTSRFSGPVLWTISRPRPGEGGHGVHAEDLVVAACWLAGMVCCWRVWRD